MDWAAWREEFPTLSRKTYLNSCSLGALPKGGRDAMNRFMDLWEEYGASAWYEIWLGEVNRVRQQFATLINADLDEVFLAPNVSTAIAPIASAIDVKPGHHYVACSDMDFPTLTYGFMARPDLQVKFARSDGVRTTLDAYREVVDEHTAVLATSHVFYTSGYVNDIKALTKLAHSHGAISLIDAYQGTGQLPTDVKAANVDVLVTGGLKWLLGGPGISYCFVKRDLHEEWLPKVTGWFAHARQFDFDPLNLTFAHDATRFNMGTPPTAAVYAGGAGLDIINEIGPAKIRERTNELGNDLIDRARDAGFKVLSPENEDERAGIIIIEMADPKKVVAKLADEKIIVDHRPGRLRLSPYFYNTIEENEIVMDAVKRAVA